MFIFVLVHLYWSDFFSLAILAVGQKSPCPNLSLIEYADKSHIFERMLNFKDFQTNLTTVFFCFARKIEKEIVLSNVATLGNVIHKLYEKWCRKYQEESFQFISFSSFRRVYFLRNLFSCFEICRAH